MRHSKHSKRYVFIGENEDGSITEIKSQDATFFENDFPKRGHVDKDSQLYELGDLELSVP